ncbi:MAG: cystathionine gamma-synthase [Proteobacteria bacterium]|nr:cystathionine gamma-synthase [Pseudomonadota bacterium]
MRRPTMNPPVSKATGAVRASIESDAQHGAVVPPLHLSSNYAFAGFGEPRRYDYTRSGNPTRDALADALAELEGGAGAVITASGMGALTLLTQFLRPGDTIVAPHDCYGGTYRLFEQQSLKGVFEVEFVDQTDLGALRDVCRRVAPKIILTESPSNPILRIADLAAIRDIATQCGALFAVDNTFLSPALQNPIEFGADLVVHSTTKYINGHSDVVGGAIVAATDELAERCTYWANVVGITGAPFDSFMTLRGLRTLHPRIRQHEENAGLIAGILEDRPNVGRVYYPGLESHEGHALARKQQRGFGGMVSFEIDGGEAAVRAFVGHLRYFSLAESLGGVESLVCHPASMTHAPVSEERKAAAGVTPALVRLSIGLESADDLVEDLLRALEAARKAPQLAAVATGSC